MSDVIEDFPDIDALMAARAGERPGFLEDTPADGLVAAVMRLAMELCVVRDRLDVVERIAAEHEPDLRHASTNLQPMQNWSRRARSAAGGCLNC